MIQQLKFYLGAVFVLPFLPLLIWQGKRLRASIPDLPEADGSRKGREGHGEPPFNLLVLGESTMAGVGVRHQNDGIVCQMASALAGKTNREINWEVIAKSGYNARKTLNELVPQITNTPFDVVVIGLSVNDVIERNSPLGWKRDLIQLLKAVRARQACPIVMANRGPVEYFPAFPWTFKMVLGNLIKLNWKVIQDLPTIIPDFYLMNNTIRWKEWQQKVDFPTSPADFFSDGVHPSKLTYRLWAEEIADFIVQNKILEPKVLRD